MKKVLLIVAIVVCVAVAGTALAVTSFQSATPKTGTLTADSYLKLSLDDCSTTGLQLEPGVPTVYTIDYDITKSASVTPNATLTIALAADQEKNLTGLSVALFTDENCTVALKLNSSTNVIDAEGTAATLSGAGTLTVAGLSADGVIYARFLLAEDVTVANIGGTMTLNLVSAAA